MNSHKGPLTLQIESITFLFLKIFVMLKAIVSLQKFTPIGRYLEFKIDFPPKKIDFILIKLSKTSKCLS